MSTPRMRSESSLSQQGGVDAETLLRSIQDFAFRKLDEQLLSVNSRLHAVERSKEKLKEKEVKPSKKEMMHRFRKTSLRLPVLDPLQADSVVSTPRSKAEEKLERYAAVRKRAQLEQQRRLEVYREDLLDAFTPMLEKEVNLILSSKVASKRNKESMINMRREIYLRRVRLELEKKKETDWSLQEMLRDQIERERLAKIESALRNRRLREETTAAALSSPISAGKDMFGNARFGARGGTAPAGARGSIMMGDGRYDLFSAPNGGSSGSLLAGMSPRGGGEGGQRSRTVSLLTRQGTIKLGNGGSASPRARGRSREGSMRDGGSVRDRASTMGSKGGGGVGSLTSRPDLA
eukprot:CAMPEP_0113883662 /NCGR_PEP_ID=MMETSP0780_2-20120614/9748_1 /TAXON_ID=652834 /ORGANISM="Palpitomonas bilix" /LENGTH=348 /DNA_ID=CAMNT_0000871039 /DNA_START=66 /DNA_END=1112 /DNA_ORIENTATION=+ /assembly_acc=CAM_ASM_000599